jgi:hypothetical protein
MYRHNLCSFIFTDHTLRLRQANITAPSERAREVQSIRGRLPPRSSNIEDFVGRVNEICYQAQRRQQMQARGLSREADVSDLYAQLQVEWRILCLRAGFVQEGSAPHLPWDQTLLLTPNRHRLNEAIVNLTSPTIHTPLNNQTDAARRLSRSSHFLGLFRSGDFGDHGTSTRGNGQRIHSLPQDLAGPESPTHNMEFGANHAAPESPSLPPYIATITLSFDKDTPKRIKLQHWRVQHSGTEHVISWEGVDPGDTLTHYIQAEAIPWTKNKSVRRSEAFHEISFHENYRLVWQKNGTTIRNGRIPIKYHFIDEENSKRFQEDVRNMELLDVFNTSRIKSGRSDSWGECGNQCLQLWCSRGGAPRFTISFWANHTTAEDLEFNVAFFKPDIHADAATRSVQLKFARLPESLEPLPSSPKSGSSRRKITFPFVRSGQYTQIIMPGSLQDFPR